jgi:hypothetical protein
MNGIGDRPLAGEEAFERRIDTCSLKLEVGQNVRHALSC